MASEAGSPGQSAPSCEAAGAALPNQPPLKFELSKGEVDLTLSASNSAVVRSAQVPENLRKASFQGLNTGRAGSVSHFSRGRLSCCASPKREFQPRRASSGAPGTS